jgi:hypothetical protein
MGTSPISKVIPSYYPYAYVQPFQPVPYATIDSSRELQIDGVKREICAFGQLQDNWDGYGATRIQNQTIDNARIAADLVLRYAPIPDISPNANGTISMEWQSDAGVAHLEIGNTRYSFYISRPADNPILDDGLTAQLAATLGATIASALFPLFEKQSSTILWDMLLVSDRR